MDWKPQKRHVESDTPFSSWPSKNSSKNFFPFREKHCWHRRLMESLFVCAAIKNQRPTMSPTTLKWYTLKTKCKYISRYTSINCLHLKPNSKLTKKHRFRRTLKVFLVSLFPNFYYCSRKLLQMFTRMYYKRKNGIAEHISLYFSLTKCEKNYAHKISSDRKSLNQVFIL